MFLRVILYVVFSNCGMQTVSGATVASGPCCGSALGHVWWCRGARKHVRWLWDYPTEGYPCRWERVGDFGQVCLCYVKR